MARAHGSGLCRSAGGMKWEWKGWMGWRGSGGFGGGRGEQQRQQQSTTTTSLPLLIMRCVVFFLCYSFFFFHGSLSFACPLPREPPSPPLDILPLPYPTWDPHTNLWVGLWEGPTVGTEVHTVSSLSPSYSRTHARMHCNRLYRQGEEEEKQRRRKEIDVDGCRRENWRQTADLGVLGLEAKEDGRVLATWHLQDGGSEGGGG